MVDVFVARQPIFEQERDLFGYKLLFRAGSENLFMDADADQATCRVVDNTLHVFGLGPLTAGRRAFINVTRRVLMHGLHSILPREHVVLDLTEAGRADAELVTAAEHVRDDGYSLAVPSSVADRVHGEYVKLDFRATPPPEREAVMSRKNGGKVLAEKLETMEDFREARRLGCSYFQGYFFCKPEIVTRKDIAGHRLSYMRILQELNRPTMNFDRIAEIVKQDLSLSVKLLRYLNSASIGLRAKVTSVKQALVMLGERNVRRWIWVLALTGMSEDQPGELVVSSLVLGRFCELVAPDAGLQGREFELFLLGMLSHVDAIMGRPMVEVLDELGISEELKGALLGDGSLLCQLFALGTAYARADWELATDWAKTLGIPDERVAQVYAQAVEWADRVFKDTPA